MIIKRKVGLLKFDFFYIKLSLCCLILYSHNIFYQQKNQETKAIDSLIEATNQVYMRYEFLPLIPLSQNILKKSEKIDYEKGLVYGNFYIANALVGIGKYKESNEYLQKSQAYRKYLEKDLMQSSRNYGLLGDNYLSLKLYSLSRKNFQMSIDELKKSKKRDRTIIRTESSTYLNIGELYKEMKKYDSAYYYIIKAKNLIRNLDAKDIEIEKNIIEIDLGLHHLEYKDQDSAKYYFNSAIRKSTLDVLVKIYAYEGLGNLYQKQKKYLEAEQSYLKAIDIIERYNYPIENFEIYKNLSQIYNLLGDSAKSENFLEQFNNNQDSLDLSKKVERDIIINDVLKIEKEIHQEENKRRMLYGGIAFGALVLIASLYVFYNFKKKSKKLVEEKESIALLKEDENKELKQKINEAFDEIITLAKTNNSSFWTRFQEVYPNFKDNFLAVSQDFKVGDLTFCAYVYLGFSSKEIADHTFKTLKTIENYRYNIRKKLSLVPDQDFNMAIKDIANRKLS